MGASIILTACAPAVVQHNNTGNAHFDEGAYDRAISEYRQAQVKDPDRAEPYFNAANVYNRQAALEATLAQTQQALKTAAPSLAAQIWYNLGNAHFDAQAWPEAVSAYQEALRINAGDADAKHNLELALKNLDEQEQQQQQEQQNQQDSEDQQAAPAGANQTERNEASPTPENQADTPGEQIQATSEPPRPAQEAEGMTPEQAQQLLQALAGNSETLQERLQEIYQVPIPSPAQDW